MRNLNYDDNSIISLKEENKNTIIDNSRNTSSDSFFTKLFNSVSKISQGLKYIMSKKIDIENNDDNYNQNIYDQVSNKFNTYEEVSLIGVPSFMENSHSLNIYNNRIRTKPENIENGNGSKMIISHNETKRDINDINNSFSKIEKEEEVINKDILQTHDSKKDNNSSFLNKKRTNKLHEEEKSESKDNNFEIKSQKSKNLIKREKSINSNINSMIMSNKNEQKNRLNNSIISLSLKSFDNIKNEINQKKEENLHNIEEMHEKHGLNYDYFKEQHIRERILDEYYKEKIRRIQVERENRQKEEEFQKLKIKKATGLKYSSVKKKPKILYKIKSSEIQFSGQPITQNKNINSHENAPNNLNLNFGKINNREQTNPNNDNKHNNSNKKENISLFGNNGNILENKKNEEENQTKMTDNKKVAIFGDLIGDNNNKEQKKIFENKQDTEVKKETQSLFGDSSRSLFGDKISNTSTLFNKSENKKEEKNNINVRGNEQQQKTNSLFNNNNPIFSSEDIKGKNIFSTSDNVKSESIFFLNNPINNNNKNEGGLFNIKKEEGGLFNQQTSVSSSINPTSLFTSNQDENKQKNQGSLLKINNPFLSTTTNSSNIPSFFGNNVNNNEQSKQQQSGLFGNNKGEMNLSLFGANNGKSLFG